MQNENTSRWVATQMPAPVQDAGRPPSHHPKQAVPPPEQARMSQQPVRPKPAAPSPPQIHSETSPQQRTGSPNSTRPLPQEQRQQEVRHGQRPFHQDELRNGGPLAQQLEDLINREPARPGTPNHIHEALERRSYPSRQDISPKFDVQSRSSRSNRTGKQRKPEHSDSPDRKAFSIREAPTRKKTLTYGSSLREHFSHVVDSSFIRKGLLEPANSAKKKGKHCRRLSH